MSTAQYSSIVYLSNQILHPTGGDKNHQVPQNLGGGGIVAPSFPIMGKHKKEVLGGIIIVMGDRDIRALLRGVNVRFLSFSFISKQISLSLSHSHSFDISLCLTFLLLFFNSFSVSLALSLSLSLSLPTQTNPTKMFSVYTIHTHTHTHTHTNKHKDKYREIIQIRVSQSRFLSLTQSFSHSERILFLFLEILLFSLFPLTSFPITTVHPLLFIPFP